MATEPNIKLEVLQGGANEHGVMSASENDADPSIAQTPGQILSREREKQGLDQLDICDRLRLQPWVVDALEKDEYHRLAAPTYARGYLCNYANLLELPEAPVLAAYDLVRADKPASTANARRMVSGSETRPAGADGPSKWAPLIGLGLLFGIAGLFAAWWFGDRGSLNGGEVPAYANTTDLEVSDAPQLNPYVADESAPAVDEPDEAAFAAGVAVEVDAPAFDAPLSSDANDVVESPVNAGFAAEPSGGSGDLTEDQLAAAAAEAAFEAQQGSGQAIFTPQQEPQLVPVEVPAISSAETAQAVVEIDGVPLAKTYSTAEFESGQPLSESTASPSVVTDSGAGYVAPVSDGRTSISLYFQQDSWAEVRDVNGSKLVYRLGQAGTSADVRGYPPFRVFLGNSPGVEVKLNGLPYDTSQHHRPNNTARFQVGADS